MISALFAVSAWIIAPPAANAVDVAPVALVASGLVAAELAPKLVVVVATAPGNADGTLVVVVTGAVADDFSPP
jgi:hypothetical protein